MNPVVCNQESRVICCLIPLGLRLQREGDNTAWYAVRDFPGGSGSKELPASGGDIRDLGLIPGSGRSPGRGHGNPLQYPCPKNPMDRGAWQTTVRGGVTELDMTEVT